MEEVSRIKKGAPNTHTGQVEIPASGICPALGSWEQEQAKNRNGTNEPTQFEREREKENELEAANFVCFFLLTCLAFLVGRELKPELYHPNSGLFDSGHGDIAGGGCSSCFLMPFQLPPGTDSCQRSLGAQPKTF